MVNGTRHSLARIPLRWMIRECFKLEVGIIFDEHMLKNKVGLDIDSILEAPKRLSPSETDCLAEPDPETELQGSPFNHILVTVLGYPFRWIWQRLPSLLVRESSQAERSRPNFTSRSEAEEELADTLSPVYDQLKKHTYWKIMEWIPCKLSLPPNLSLSVAMSSYVP